jgi:hypothetical protein
MRRKYAFHALMGLIFILASQGLPAALAEAFRDLGVPVRDAIVWGVPHVGPGKTGARDTVYLSLGQYNAPLSLLAVDPSTGATRQFNGPLASEMGSWDLAVDGENRIYLGTYYQAHLFRFDPKTEQWEDLGRPGGDSESFICGLSIGADGKVWGGTFPSAKLFSYDPKTGETHDYGRMDPDQFYCYPTAGDDGLIYNAIQFQKIDLVVFDPEKGLKTSLLRSEDRRPGRLKLIKGKDGKIYASLSTREGWFRVEEGRRLDPVAGEAVPFPVESLPDGRTVEVADGKVRLKNPVTGVGTEFPLRYEAQGAFIFVVGAGPDGKVYGSSMLPLRLFSYDPEGGSLVNLGRAARGAGEIYSLGSLDGRLYLCSYPEARLSVYDPGKPLRYGEEEGANPRDLGPMGEGLYRPRAMVAGPYGKVFVGGYPDYGVLGGAIGVYDPEKGEKRTHPNVIENQSIASLAWASKPGLLVAGSSVRGGTGTRAVENEAKLILWDPGEERKVFETTPVPGAKTILSLAVAPSGVVYGITENEKVFVFDPEKREVLKVFDLGFREPIETTLQPGPGGLLYGLVKETLFTIDPRNDRVELLASPPVPVTSGMAVVGRKIYFGSQDHLWEYEIPAIPPAGPLEKTE